MSLSDKRFDEIDAEVQSAGFAFDPFTGDFIPHGGEETDRRSEIDVRQSLSDGFEVPEEEFHEYVGRKRREDDKFVAEEYFPEPEPEEPE